MVAIRPTRAPALGDQLTAVLRDQIIRRTLANGTHLVEDALAAEYGVSRGPVRDALRQLESQGLVESRRRGYFVVGLTQEDIDDLYELREAIELAAVSNAMARASAKQLSRAREIVREMSDYADRSAAADFAAADMRFHALLYEMSGNRRLIDVWKSYEPVFASLIQLTVEEDVDLRPSAQDHGLLVDLVEGADDDALRAELRDHLDGARARMARAVQALNDAKDSAEVS